jgi:hypothetical protein
MPRVREARRFVRQTHRTGRLLGALGGKAKVRHEAARVHHAARRGGGRVGLLLEVDNSKGRQERAPLVGGTELTSRRTDATATEELTGKGGAIEAAQHRAAPLLKQDVECQYLCSALAMISPDQGADITIRCFE